MFCSSYSRIFFAVFLTSLLCYSCLSKKAVGVASDIPDMESSDESHKAKRDLTGRKEKRTLNRKSKRIKHKQQKEKENNLERSGRKEKGRPIKSNEKKKKNKTEKIRIEKGAYFKMIPKRKPFKKRRKNWLQSKNGSRQKEQEKDRRKLGVAKDEAIQEKRQIAEIAC